MNKFIESERFERHLSGGSEELDNLLCEKILALLDNPQMDNTCFVDAFYYDYCELPQDLQHKYCRDMYLIFGITLQGEIISKWVERNEL